VWRSAVALIVLLGVCGCARAASDANPQAAPSPTLPIATGHYPAYGHAADYSWIAGRIVRSVPAGQCTYVVYSTHTGDAWGGRIALSSSSAVDRYPDGDMVVVSGTLDSGALSPCGHPIERVATIEEH